MLPSVYQDGPKKYCGEVNQVCPYGQKLPGALANFLRHTTYNYVDAHFVKGLYCHVKCHKIMLMIYM